MRNGKRESGKLKVAGLRVLHLITRLDRGGSAENTLLSVIGLGRLGHRVTLASGDSAESQMTPGEIAGLNARLAEARASGVELTVVPSLRRRLAPLHDLIALAAIIRLIRRIRPQVVHTHTSKAGALGRLAAWLCRVPVIVHTPHGHIFYGYYGPLLTTAFIAVERWLGRLTDGLITLTDVGKQDYLDRRIIPMERLMAIPSGIDLSAYRPGLNRLAGVIAARRLLALPRQGPIIGIMGRLVPVKGHRYLIEALPAILHEFPDALLLCVGEGEERASLAARAEALGVEQHLLLVGAQPALHRYIAACDLVVQPSLNEGMGRTVIEALVMGRPVVASRVGGLPDLITHDYNGLLVPPASPSALADAICTVLRDPVRRRRMSDAARRSVGGRYSVQAMVAAIDALYQQLAQLKRVASEAVQAPRRIGPPQKPSRARSRSTRVPISE